MDRTENTVPLLLFPIVAVQTCLFAKPLLSNGCCIFAYLVVVAQQWVYTPHYYPFESYENRFRRHSLSTKLLYKFDLPVPWSSRIHVSSLSFSSSDTH
jgi:hypothetical protein